MEKFKKVLLILEKIADKIIIPICVLMILLSIAKGNLYGYDFKTKLDLWLFGGYLFLICFQKTIMFINRDGKIDKFFENLDKKIEEEEQLEENKKLLLGDKYEE